MVKFTDSLQGPTANDGWNMFFIIVNGDCIVHITGRGVEYNRFCDAS